MKLKNNGKWLYKYMPFNLNTIKVIINNKLWFGEPNKLNDPYEMEFIMNYNNNKNILYERAYRFPLNKDLKKVIKETDSGKLLNDGFERGRFETCLKNNIKNHVGICSFSMTYDDILMWSHYANGHKGICLVFDKEKLEKCLNATFRPRPVNYKDEVPQCKFEVEDSYGILHSNMDLFNHKLLNWKREEEHRIVKVYTQVMENKNIDRLISFSIDSIVGVIVGEKFTENNFETLANLFYKRNDGHKVYFWQSEKNIHERKMRVYSIPMDDNGKKKSDSLGIPFRIK